MAAMRNICSSRHAIGPELCSRLPTHYLISQFDVLSTLPHDARAGRLRYGLWLLVVNPSLLHIYKYSLAHVCRHYSKVVIMQAAIDKNGQPGSRTKRMQQDVFGLACQVASVSLSCRTITVGLCSRQVRSTL